MTGNLYRRVDARVNEAADRCCWVVPGRRDWSWAEVGAATARNAAALQAAGEVRLRGARTHGDAIVGCERIRCRQDLDEVDALVLREPESVAGGHDPQLAPIFVHDPHLRDADHLVDAQVSAQASSLISYVPIDTMEHSAADAAADPHRTAQDSIFQP